MYKRDGTPDFYLVKGITDFRCGINRLSEIIRDKQTVNVFDNAAFIFTCKNKQGVASASQLVFIANYTICLIKTENISSCAQTFLFRLDIKYYFLQ